MRILRGTFVVLLSAGAAGAFVRAQDQESPPAKDDKKEDKKEDKKDEKKSKGDEEQKKLLEKRLHVPPNYSVEDGTVDLSYDFTERNQKKDWTASGLERFVVGNETKENAAHMELGAGSEKVGLVLLDAVEWKGDFTLETSAKILWRGTSSQLGYVFGSKSKNAWCLAWGDETLKLVNGGKQHVGKEASTSEQEYSKERVVSVKIQREGDKIQSWVQGDDRGTRTYKKGELDGKVGFYMENTLKVEIQRFHIHGVVGKLKG